MNAASVWWEELIEAKREAAALILAQDFPYVPVVVDVVSQRETGGSSDGHASNGESWVSVSNHMKFA
jgi:hypothetical protein